MGRVRIVAATLALVVFAGVASWLLAAESLGALPPGRYTPLPSEDLLITGPESGMRRRDILRRAAFKVTPPNPRPLADFPSCMFLEGPPSGTSPKFDCVLDGGEVVKVKYSRNPE